MKPAAFRYHVPRTADQVLEMLAAVAPDEGRILAGGQSLIPTMALRLARPSHLVDINGVEGFDRLEVRDGVLCIGPCVRHVRLDSTAAPGPLGPLLGHVQGHVAHRPIRTRGTFCGSVANADSASEWCMVSATLGAEMVARSLRGTRVIPVEDFFLSFMTTALEPDELLAEVRLPLLSDDRRFGFHEFARRAGDYAQAMSLAVFSLHGGVISDPRVGLGGVEGHPRRFPAVEAALAGQAPSAALFRDAAARLRPSLRPLEDTPYRRGLAETAIERALADACRDLAA